MNHRVTLWVCKLPEPKVTLTTYTNSISQLNVDIVPEPDVFKGNHAATEPQLTWSTDLYHIHVLCGADAVVWRQSDAVPGAVCSVNPGRPADRMFPSIPALRAFSVALSLFVFPSESYHYAPPALPCYHSASARM